MFFSSFKKAPAVLVAAFLIITTFTGPTAASTSSLKIVVNVHLEGATRAGQSGMATALSERDLIPTTDPYGFNQTYSGFVDAVDWVEIELRDETTLTVVAEGAAILRSDGSVVSGNGTPFRLTADRSVPYHVIVRHRNHIPEQSPPVLAKANKLEFDFTANNEPPYGGSLAWHVDLNGDGLYGAIPANGAQSTPLDIRTINSADREVWRTNNGQFDQYLDADYNMDGDVNGADKITWTQAKDLIVFVPVP